MKTRIADPLGMKDFGYHPRPEDESRLAAQYAFDPVAREFSRTGSANPAIVTENYDSGGGGVVTRVSDYVLLADALANDGTGACLSADAENHVAIFYTQHVFGYGDTYTVIHPKVRDLVCEALAGEW